MASTKQERVLAKSREAAQAGDFSGSLGQPGVSGTTSRGFSRHLDQYNSVGQKPTPVHLVPPSVQPRPPSPPPEYEESPFRLVTGTNRDIDIQETGTPVHEDPVQPKEFADDDNYYRSVGEVKSLRRKRKGIIVIIIITNAVILCAVLGGVLGSMAGKRASSSTASGGGNGGQVYASTSPSITTAPIPYSSSPLTSSSFVPPATVTATVTVPASTGVVVPSRPGGNDGFPTGHASIPEGTPGGAGNLSMR